MSHHHTYQCTCNLCKCLRRQCMCLHCNLCKCLFFLFFLFFSCFFFSFLFNCVFSNLCERLCRLLTPTSLPSSNIDANIIGVTHANITADCSRQHHNIKCFCFCLCLVLCVTVWYMIFFLCLLMNRKYTHSPNLH